MHFQTSEKKNTMSLLSGKLSGSQILFSFDSEAEAGMCNRQKISLERTVEEANKVTGIGRLD